MNSRKEDIEDNKSNVIIGEEKSRLFGGIDQDIMDESLEKNLRNLFGKNIVTPENWIELNRLEKKNLLDSYFVDYYPNLPKTLVTLSAGALVYGDSGRNPDEYPDWLDREKFSKGQKFARENFAGISFAGMLAIFILYSFEDNIKPLIITGKTIEPYTTFKRYLSTTNRIRNWYSSDIWRKGTRGYNDIRVVRRMHANIRKKLHTFSNEELDRKATLNCKMSKMEKILAYDFKAACRIPLIGQCPYTEKNYRDNRPLAVNQFEMSITQWSNIGLVLSFPQSFGIHNASKDDLDAFCHVWKGIGYLLGIEDEYNFCDGTFEEIVQRSNDVFEFWAKPNLRNINSEWEHMVRCLVEGIGYYCPGSSYESSMMYLGDLMKIQMPTFLSSISFFTWLQYYMQKILLHYCCRLEWVRNILNKILKHGMDEALHFSEAKHIELQKRSEKSLKAASLRN